MYHVRRLLDVNHHGAAIEARAHRDAAAKSRLSAPGTVLIVNGQGASVRFHVDAAGRIREESRYDARQP